VTFSLLTPGAFAAETEKWNGTVLGFENPQKGCWEMSGIRPILEDNGFHYNLGYLNEMAYNAGGGYNHDKQLAYIDQVALTTQDLERWTGIRMRVSKAISSTVTTMITSPRNGCRIRG
jgi:porin